MKKLVVVVGILLTSFFGAYAQDTSIKLKVKQGSNPVIYIDGKKYDYAILKLLDQNKIASIDVIKDASALKEYNAKNGVILITTKENAKSESFIASPRVKLKGVENGKEPVIIINGKVFDGSLSTIDPENIETINVIKDGNALKEYNAPNGVIIIKTKDGKSKED